MLSDQEFIRYQRQIGLTEIGEQGQINLQNAHVLVIGLGGLGSAACLYLAAAGIGKLVLVDDDRVEMSNLQRQVSYRQSDIGYAKTEALQQQLHSLNQNCQIRCVHRRMGDKQLELEVCLADVILDCSDNFATRQQLNRVCYRYAKPLIFASATCWQGQFAIFDFSHPSSRNYGCVNCLVPDSDDHSPTMSGCQQLGIIGPVVGCLGNYQALAAIQYLACNAFLTECGVLHCFDGKALLWSQFELKHDSNCSVCQPQMRVETAANSAENTALRARCES